TGTPTVPESVCPTVPHTDHLATPRKATNEAGQVVWQWESEAFGNALPQSSGIAVNLRFPGQYYDAGTGLYYNYFRYYDPEVGRYITSDPIGLQGGLNTYGYVGGNPINVIDPTGEGPAVVIIPAVIITAAILAYKGCVEKCMEEKKNCGGETTPGQMISECGNRCAAFLDFLDTPLDLKDALAEFSEWLGGEVGESFSN
ncbi:MAG: hypothetical protein GY829_12965, partial [Gammaproteobacteria bacterium]|nr:hypothetical protein [Gammaproteobacteria bacterium]